MEDAYFVVIYRSATEDGVEVSSPVDTPEGALELAETAGGGAVISSPSGDIFDTVEFRYALAAGEFKQRMR